MSGQHSLRVALLQPALPAYRIPVFEALSKRSSVDLTVFYGGVKNLDNVADGTFDRVLVRDWWLAGDRLQVSPVQIKTALSRDFDVVIAPWASRSLSLIPSLLLARMRGVGTVVWGHGFSKQETPVRRWVRNLSARMASAVVFYAQPAAQAFREETGLAGSVFVAPNTIDVAPVDAAIETWRARTSDRRALLKDTFQTAGAETQPLLLHVSRLLAENRVDLLIEALGALDRVNLAIIGDGPERDDLERFVAKNGLERRVAFLGAVYEESRLAPWFLSSTAFVYPGNIGLSCNHALAYGVPVVTSDDLKSHNPEIACLSPGRNGLLYKALDSESLALEIRRVVAGEAGLDAGDQIRRQFRAQFGLEKMVDGLEAAIRHAAANAKP